jgi:hypothetical protein
VLLDTTTKAILFYKNFCSYVRALGTPIENRRYPFKGEQAAETAPSEAVRGQPKSLDGLQPIPALQQPTRVVGKRKNHRGSGVNQKTKEQKETKEAEPSIAMIGAAPFL